MEPKAKKAEFFSLATAIQVKGTFTDYKIGVQPGGAHRNDDPVHYQSSCRADTKNIYRGYNRGWARRLRCGLASIS
jgi:hypothetical protein